MWEREGEPHHTRSGGGGGGGDGACDGAGMWKLKGETYASETKILQNEVEGERIGLRARARV